MSKYLVRQLKTFFWITRNMCRKNNLTPYDKNPILTKPIYGVYHIFCDGNWKSLFKEQINHLYHSGLYNVTTKLYISVIYKNNTDIQWIEQYPLLNNDRFGGIIAKNSNASVYEYPALDFIRFFSLNKDVYIYYFHSKGVTYHGRDDLSKERTKRIKLGEEWRIMMEYFIFDKWKVAYNVLRTYDTYGCRLNNEYFPLWNKRRYYAGNFWWAKSQWINNLEPIEQEKKSNRWFAELWLLSKPGKFFCTFWGYYQEYKMIPDRCLYNSDLHSNFTYRLRCLIKFAIQYYSFYITFYQKKIILKIINAIK